MGKGRRAEPAAIKEAKGNPGKRPIANPPEQMAISGLKQPPAWLNTAEYCESVKAAAAAAEKDEAEPPAVETRAQRISRMSLEIWSRLHGDLEHMKLLKSTDEDAFARFCRYMAEWIDFTRQIDLEGPTYTTESNFAGKLRRPNPAVRFRKEVEQSLKDLGDSMGLTPSARQRILQHMAQTQPPLPPGGGHPRNGEPSEAEGADSPPAAPLGSSIGIVGRMH